ncbi:hypothetical protein [Okeania sp. SIO2C9]|uniref:hypothetical protein n=1 Tax=Okeania sp. SIO2C9 TaxID=2607791 RepID=UPI0025F32743|nr:hypothetical protein [Okeania sp. SIO2C9]
MLKDNLILSFLSTTVIAATTIPTQAASFEKASFSDNFNDGVVNSSIYSPIKSASIIEEDGGMILTGGDGDGVSIDLINVLPEGEGFWFGFDVEFFDFVIGDSLSVSIAEPNGEGGIFNELLVEFVSVLSDSGNPSHKAVITLLDEDGEPISLPFVNNPLTIPLDNSPLEPGATYTFSVDWVPIFEGRGKQREKVGKEWLLDWKTRTFGPDEGVQLIKEKIKIFGPLATASGAKKINITLGSNREDPGTKFDRLAANEIHPIPEHSSVITFLALGTLGAASTLKRKAKISKEKELEKISEV